MNNNEIERHRQLEENKDTEIETQIYRHRARYTEIETQR